MNELIDLYNTNGHSTDKHNCHTYLFSYDDLFKRFKDGNNNILEIGIYRGDSLNLWAEYFTHSKIYGIDKNTSQINKRLNPNVCVLKLNAYSFNTVDVLKSIGKFNIIIDDGSHLVKHQKFVIENYLSLLSDDGILIIEDITLGMNNRYGIRDIRVLLDCFPEEFKRQVYYIDNRGNSKLVNDVLIICDKSRL